MDKIPGPSSWPQIGNALNFMPGGRYSKLPLNEIHQALKSDHGPLIMFKGFLGRKDLVLSFKAEDIEQVYRNEGQWPIRRSLESFTYYRKKIRPDLYSQTGGLLTESGQAWQDVRSKVNPVMMNPKTVKQYISPVEEVADDFIARMIKLRDKDGKMPKDFGNELNKWSLETIGRIALDTRLGCLVDNLPADSEAQKMIMSVHDFMELTFQIEVLPSMWKYYATPPYKKLMKAFDTMTNVAMKYIDAAILKLDDKKVQDPDAELSVLEKLLKIDKHVGVVMAMDMLLAGIDTTSSTIASLLYQLATHPEKQDKLREELRRILPEKSSKLTTSSFNTAPYLKACLKESARIYPVAIGNARETGRDLVLSGYRIPKGTDVVLGHMVLSITESEYPNPMAFIPERWINTRSSPQAECPKDGPSECPSAKSAHPFAYMPFGFGPRMCIGRRFAELEIEVLVTKLFRNYKVEWGGGDFTINSKLINVPDAPLTFKITEIAN